MEQPPGQSTSGHKASLNKVKPTEVRPGLFSDHGEVKLDIRNER
jgi:hypothetical protein